MISNEFIDDLFKNEYFVEKLGKYLVSAKVDPVTNHVGLVCPICGRSLKVCKNSRDGNYFYGCSGFPACRFSDVTARPSSDEIVAYEEFMKTRTESRLQRKELIQKRMESPDYKIPKQSAILKEAYVEYKLKQANPDTLIKYNLPE